MHIICCTLCNVVMEGEFIFLNRVAGKDKRLAHLEEKVSDLKEARIKRTEAVSSKIISFGVVSKSKQTYVLQAIKVIVTT